MTRAEDLHRQRPCWRISHPHGRLMRAFGSPPAIAGPSAAPVSSPGGCGPRGTGRQGRARCQAGSPAGRAFAAAVPLRGSAPVAAGVAVSSISAIFGQVRNRLPLLHEDLAQDASNGDGTSAFTLSVMTSRSGSSWPRGSPGCLSHLPIVPRPRSRPAGAWSPWPCNAPPMRWHVARAVRHCRSPVEPTRWP